MKKIDYWQLTALVILMLVGFVGIIIHVIIDKAWWALFVSAIPLAMSFLLYDNGKSISGNKYWLFYYKKLVKSK